MINRLSRLNIENLKKLPETGMGYQIVKVNGVNYNDKDIVVLNGQLAISRDALQDKNMIKALIGDNFTNALKSAKEIHLTFNIAPYIEPIGSNVSEDDVFEQKAAKNSISENANGDELFVRLSAFEDDIRVDKENKCLLPGTFTTTASDALKCKVEKDDPVQRYALPNELTIEWAFYIQPKQGIFYNAETLRQTLVKKGRERSLF
ncbi:MAG: hypothetical protein WKG06_28765 [Segetibacter sp.]